MNSLNRMIATGLLMGIGLAAQPMMASAAPELSIQSERAAHPPHRRSDQSHERGPERNGGGSG